jgi:hypothetical protein
LYSSRTLAEAHRLAGCFSDGLLPVAFRALHDALGIATCLRARRPRLGGDLATAQ